jgi:adhesin/invasin
MAVRSCVYSLALILSTAVSIRAQSYGTISTFAGTGVAGFSGDQGPATSAQLNTPRRVEVDAAGNLYLSDSGNNRIRKVGPDGTITTVAGTGTAGFGGDNGLAVNAQLNQPTAIIFDPAGNLYIADSSNNRVRRVGTDGIIVTVAGNGEQGSEGDGGPATAAQLNNPFGLAYDSAGNLYIADAYNSKIRRVAPTGIITTYAGTGTPESTGDGGLATGATLKHPYALTVDKAGSLYLSDVAANKVRRIDQTTGVITTIAGTGGASFSGDGGPATNAELNGPTGIVFDAAGNLYLTDLNNNRVRMIDTSGVISTVAGDGSPTYTNDGDVSLNAGVGSPIDVVIDADGLMYVAQRDFHVIRIVVPTAHPSRITGVSGSGQTAAVSTAFADPLIVLVTDKNSHPVKNVTVVWSTPISGASAGLSAITTVTGKDGQTSVTATANSAAGSYQVAATIAEIAAQATFTLTNTAASPTQIVFESQPASNTAGSTINAVTVKVLDGSGNPSAGVTLTMTAQGGAGTLQGTTTVATNSTGLATFSDLRINTTGTYQLKATAGSVSQLSNAFDITAAASRTITVVSGSGQSATVSTAYASPLKAAVEDSFGNPVVGASVTFTAPSSGASVTFGGPASVTTDSNGVATSAVVTANTQSGSFQVTAATSGAAPAAVFHLTNVPGPGNKLVFGQQPANAKSGQVIAPPVTVQLEDSFGNSVANPGVAVTVQANPLTQRFAAISGTTTQNTNAAGLATFADLSLAHSGNYQLIAGAASYASAQSNPFTITAGNPTSIATSGGTPQSATISAAFADPLAVVVRDASGNPVSGVTVTFTAPASGPSAMLSAGHSTTDTGGRASVIATANNIAGSYTVTASVPGVAGTASFVLTNVAAGAAVLTFVQQPAGTTAGATIGTVSVKLTDSGGNGVAGTAVTLSAEGAAGTLQGTVTGSTDATGTATFNDLRITVAGTYRLKAVAGALSALSNTFAITPAAAANVIVFDGDGQSAAVGTAYGTPLRASVQDAFGNPAANAPVTFQAPASGASVTFAGPTTVTTDALGVATAPIATANGTTGTFQVTATTPGATQPAAFHLTNLLGTADSLSFLQQPTDTISGQAIAPAVTVQLHDSFGNPVGMAGVAVTIQAGPLATRTRAGTATANTDATGLATFADIRIAQSGPYTLTAEAAEFASATSNPFRITAGPAATIQATSGTPQSATALTVFAEALQVTVSDVAGNPVSGANVAFTAPGSGPSATLSAAHASTDANGRAEVTATANAIAGSYAVQATVAGAGSASFNLSNVSGGASNLTFVQQPVNTPAGTAMTVAVKLADANGNPVGGASVSLTLPDSTAILIGTTTLPTGGNGIAMFANLSINTTGAFQMQATSGAISMLSSPFQITPAASRTITAAGGGGQSTVVSTAYALPLTATVSDQFGNAVPGAVVTFTAPANGAGVTFAGSNSVSTGTDGAATSPALTANSQTGSFQVSATVEGAPSPTVFNLTNLAGTAHHLSFIQQPTTTTSGHTISPPITVQVRDTAGNAVSQAGAVVTLVGSNARALRGQPPPATTDATGLATFAGITVSQAGAYTALGHAEGLSSAQSEQFNVNPDIPSMIVATGGTPQSTLVSTAFPEALRVIVTDAAGNAVSGVPVVFAAPLAGASGTFGGATTVTVMTDPQGKAAVPITANGVPGSYIVSATSAPVTGQAQFTLSNLSLAPEGLTFAQQPTNTPAGQTISPAVKVRVTDSSGSPIPTAGIPILISLSSGTGTLSGTTVQVTDSSGTATFGDLSIDLTGTKQLRAISDQNVPAVSSAFQISPGAAAVIAAISGSPQSTSPSQLFPSLLQARVTDGKGNPVAGVNVSFAVPPTGPGGSFSGSPVAATDANGLATAPPLTANGSPGSFSVTASVPGVASPATFLLTILPAPSSALEVLPAQISFASETAQSAPAPQTVQLKNSDGRVESWTAISSAPWITARPPTGSTPATVNIGVDPSGLAPGTYSGTVTFTTPTGQASLFVIYQVAAKPVLGASPSSLMFLGIRQGAIPAQIVSISSTGRSISYHVAATISGPPGSEWLQISKAQGQTPDMLQVSVNADGLAAGIYHGSVQLTPAEAGLSGLVIPVTLGLGPVIQSPIVLGVTNAGSFHPGGAPGGLMTIFGLALSDAVYQASTLPLPQILGPTSVTVNGIPAPLYYASPTQINFQMPSGLPAGTAQIVVNSSSLKATSENFPAVLTAVDPGLFVTPDGRAAALNQDLSLHSGATPQPAGAIVIVYLTGQGPTTPSVQDGSGAPVSPLALVTGQVSAQIGGKPADVVFAGLAPGFVGDTQVNVRIPQGVEAGDRPVILTINGVSSNAGVISVR